MVAEVVGGLVSGSLALLADAGHMFTDAGALGLAWFAAGIAQRPADWKRSYGFDRFSVVVAFANGLALFAIAALIVYEAVQRLFMPAEVMGVPMLLVAAAGLGVNIAAFFILHGAEKNLNVRGAVLHVLGDLLGSVAAIVAAIVIIYTGWMPIDPILSVLVALLILRSAWSLVRESGHILLEAAPAEIDSRAIAADLTANVAGIADVHHIHVWSITEERRMATLHARLAEEAGAEAVVGAIKSRLAEKFGIAHATIEVEFGPCADPNCAGEAA
jgi:cobalt-zinc-cadmium efflux system protein